MRRAVLVVASTLLAISCSPGLTGSPSPTTPPCVPASSYGLMLFTGRLEVVSTCGTVVASALVGAPSVQTLGQGGPGVVLQPPVSATRDKVFFRDGDAVIRYLTPDGRTGDVTTVPAGPKLVSFFSVSPDDLRIAVVVVDLSNVQSADQRIAAGQISADSINLRLYVEDLQGGGHHADIYSTTWTNKQGGINTLWPMGWHSGQLVLALMHAYTFEAPPPPGEWHVADASTADRLATIGGGNCSLGFWPSPAGAGCADWTKPEASIYDWTGKLTATVPSENFGADPELSPSGRLWSLSNGGGLGDPAPVTRIASVAGGPATVVAGHMACLWIDDSNWLARDAVVAFPSGVVKALPVRGQCAGRFPGGL
jgi:hypothetical protein